MNRFFKQKHPYLAIPAVFLVVLFLGLAQLGSTVNPAPKNLPVLLVQSDSGVKLPTNQEMNFGKTIEDKLSMAPASVGVISPLHWSILGTEQEAIDAMNHEQAYAAIVVPADFSTKITSLLTPQPLPSLITVYVNQGMNYNGAAMTNQVISQMVAGINVQIREQLLAQLGQHSGTTLTIDQAKAFASPISVTTKMINAVGTNSSNGNAPIVLTQLAWFGAMVGTMLLFIASMKAVQSGSRLHRLGIRVAQISGGVVVNAAAAGSILLIAGQWLGLSIPNYGETYLFLFFAGFIFFLLQTAIVSWLGLAGVPLFVLVFFFGAPVLSLPPQLLPAFSHDWLYSWIPLRFSVEGLRDLFYFGKGLNIGDAIWTLSIIGFASIVLSLLSVLKKHKEPAISVEQGTAI
ncbi:YhgE/Pip domain-containing protein [Paenibacillus psychroresistens]|nr:ABC transporter permease [Paenibacillus psychroresistens]